MVVFQHISAKTQVIAGFRFLANCFFILFLSAKVSGQKFDFVGPVLPTADQDDETIVHAFHPEVNLLDSLFLNYVPSVDMELVQDRATCMESDIPLVVNETVCGFIHYFTVKRRGYTRAMLEKKHFYYPIFEYYLKQYNMPDALKHLAIVESGLNYNAKSPAGAVGLWQFMPGTGKQMNLNQNNHIDERQNPWLATEAACKYLKSLHNMFKDWELALAAYNCGPGNVLKAQRRSGKIGFWEIYGSLPKETRSYVPQFYAVVYAMHFSREHNIFPDVNKVLTFTALDTFRTNKSCNLEKLESILGLSSGVLLRHNHDLKSSFFPGGTLLVPETHSGLLEANFDKFIDSARYVLPQRTASRKETGAKDFRRVYLKKGSDIRLIAKKYGMAYQTFCKVNKVWGKQILKSRNYLIPSQEKTEIQNIAEASSDKINSPDNAVLQSQKLIQSKVAPQSEQQAPESKPAEKSVASQKVEQGVGEAGLEKNSGSALKSTKPVAEANQSPPHPNVSINSSGKEKQVEKMVHDAPSGEPEKATLFYEVRLGDGLYNIARAYGMDLDQIKELNPNLGKHIFVGQKIRVIAGAVFANSDSSKLSKNESSGKPKSSQTASSGKSKSKQQIRPKVYTVQKGDTLYSITRKFNRLTVKDLIKLNKLKNNQIKPGQSLIIG